MYLKHQSNYLQSDILEDQYFMTFEYIRSNQLMTELANDQKVLLGKRNHLEMSIMAKQGENDEAEWEELWKVRKDIDALSEETIQLIQKNFNLTQKFVQEAQIQNSDQQEGIKNEKSKNPHSNFSMKHQEQLFGNATSGKGAAKFGKSLGAVAQAEKMFTQNHSHYNNNNQFSNSLNDAHFQADEFDDLNGLSRNASSVFPQDQDSFNGRNGANAAASAASKRQKQGRGADGKFESKLMGDELGHLEFDQEPLNVASGRGTGRTKKKIEQTPTGAEASAAMMQLATKKNQRKTKKNVHFQSMNRPDDYQKLSLEGDPNQMLSMRGGVNVPGLDNQQSDFNFGSSINANQADIADGKLRGSLNQAGGINSTNKNAMGGRQDSIFPVEEEEETEVCAKCKQYRYINLSPDEDQVWIGCNKCPKWFHIQCTGIESTADVDNIDFVCCDGSHSPHDHQAMHTPDDIQSQDNQLPMMGRPQQNPMQTQNQDLGGADAMMTGGGKNLEGFMNSGADSIGGQNNNMINLNTPNLTNQDSLFAVQGDAAKD